MPSSWVSLGPGATRNGHGATDPVVGGRVTDIAFAADAATVYAATEGGLWRSDNLGKSWYPLLDDFRVTPTFPTFENRDRSGDLVGVSVQACGAVVCDIENPDTVYVGTGDYSADGRGCRGVGILKSEDGGQTWEREAIAGGSDNLDGAIVYAMAIDPGNPARVCAATSRGLYRRHPDGGGGFHWEQRRIHATAGADNGLREHTTSVVVARDTSTNPDTIAWFIAQQGGDIYVSNDFGANWNPVVSAAPGLTPFVNANDTITLGVDENDRSLLYALVSTGRLLRADVTAGGPWQEVNHFPATHNRSFGGAESEVHQCLAVNPLNRDQVFFGGARSLTKVGGVNRWHAALYRADIRMVAGAPDMTVVNIGRSVPAYANAIAFSPHSDSHLMVGCDSGMFYSSKPQTIDPKVFEQRNGSLVVSSMNSLSHHPEQESFLLCGTSGNGGVRYTGEETWAAAYNSDHNYDNARGVHLGDAGYVAVNWHDPYQVLFLVPPSSTAVTAAAPAGRPKALVIKASNGGANPDPPNHQEVVVALDAGDAVHPYSPLVANPHATATAAEADRVAFGSKQLWVSDTFGAAGSWNKAGGVLPSAICSIAFASFSRIYVGCVEGEVYRYDHGGGGWAATRLDTQPGLPSGAGRIAQPVTAIAVHPTHADHIYISFGGAGVHDRLWFYNGASWESRHSPTAPVNEQLPQTQANAVVIDPADPDNTLYVGTDNGVWITTNHGQKWESFNDGLPEIPVSYLLLHVRRRLLRCATRGRGLFERQVPPPDADTPDVQLYVRDHRLDTGIRTAFALPKDDPTDNNANPGARRQVAVNTSPDIKIDTPDAQLQYVIEDDTAADFVSFADTIPDDAASVAVPADPNLMSIVSRVYLQVHNRGKSRAHNVRVVLLACRDNGGVPELPNDFQLEVQRGTSIEGDGWLTVGQHLLNDVLPGRPAVVRFELSTDNLKKLGAITAGSNFRLLALLDHDQDRFTATTRNVQTLTNDERKAAGKKITTATLVAGAVPDAPMRTNSWKPIGPAGILKGQAPIRCLMSGRVPDIAIARDGRRVYAATCNAGVWRSDDRGAHWRPCMRGFDLNPEGEAHRFLHWLDPRGIDTLSMGAIALDENNPDRIYVGTGEAHNGYMGVGPLISTDGGQSWKREPLREGNLIGHGFFALAVDPADTQCVVAATTNGIYRREPEAQGSSIYYWHKKRPMAPPPPPSQDIYSSVVVARNGGNTRFFAARYGGRVFESANGGDTWTEIAGYPTAAGVLRVLLAIQRGNINTIYAYNQLGDVHRVTRANIGAAWGAWRQIGNLPGANDLRTDQLYYDMALDVAPDNVNVLLIGSSYRETSPGVYGGGIYRLTIGAGSNVTDADYLGNSIHPDIHCIRFRPGSSREMWVGCDGGMFYAEDAYAEGANVFINRNAGLQSLEMNHLGVHPRSEAVLFCGTQDNGGLRYTGEEAWLHVTGGDGGYAVVDRNDPHNYLISYVRRKIFGSTVGSFSREAHGRGVIVPPHPTAGDQELFYAPLEVSPTGNSQFLAFGSRALWISINFGGAAAADWNYSPLIAPVDPANVGRSCICCIRIVSPNLVYVGTLDGQVLRYRNPPPPPPGAAWPAPNMLHNDNEVASGGAFSVITRGRPITSIAIDPALPNNESLYITLGGNGNWQRVWHYDATANNWQHRSGTGTNRLLSSIATKIIVDPNHNDHLYVGTDVGIWQSTDSGTNWRPFSNRLPDTTIKDLEWHSGGGIKLLRASTYGSGVWEYLMDNDQVPAVELYLRNSQLDGGREGVTTQYGANWTDPTDTAKTQTRFGSSPDIKIDRPNNSGNYTFDHYHTASYVDFVDTLPDPDSCATAVVHEQPIVNRVYIQVHNRGIVQADEVEVVLLVGARTAANVPANLPNDWRTRILLGGTINTNDWKLIGRKKLDGINAALPQVVRFDILSTHLPRPSDLPAQQHKGLLAIVYHRRYDPLRGNEVAVQDLCNNHRQAAYKSITVSRFTGTLPQEVEALPAFVPNLVPLTVAALTARKLRELNRQLQLKIGTAGATIRPTERRVQRMAERAVAMFESGETVPAPQDLDLFTGFSKFALLGCMIWDLPDFADILSPKRGWIGDVMRRGTPDPNLSHALVPSSQFAVRAGEIAVSRASDSERPKVQAFVMGMMSALASNVTCNPLLRGMQANRSSIDWDHRRIGIDDYAVSLWIAKELLSNIPSSDQWQSWWPERSEVPDAIFEGIAEALTEVYDPASVTAAVFSDNPASEIDTSVPSAEDIADGYRFYYNTMGSSSGALVWFLILSPLLLMPSVALLISLGMPNAKRLLTTEKKEPNESSWYELYVTSMATGSLFPFIYSMILWGIVPKNTSYFVQALLFGLARFGIAAASFATTSASPELRWGLLFSTPTAFDIYFLIRTIVSAAKGHPGYARLWLLQMFPILTAGANLIFALMSFKGNREKSWVFWLLWAVYTLGIWLGVGIYSAIAIARDGGLFSLLSNRTDPDRPDLTGIDQRSLYRLTESRVSAFHDSLLWEQGGADLAHKRYPSGKRSLIKIWVDHDNMHIRHDRDIVVIKRGDDETPVPLDGPMTPAAIVTELVKVDGVHAEIYSNDDPAYDLPAPKMFADPGDSSQTWAEHDEKSDDFVPLSRDQNSPYILCHTPRSALCSTLGAAGTSSSEDVPLRLVPEGGTEAFDGTGVDMAADLASLFCMGATPSVNGEDIAVPNIAAPDNTLDKVYQIFHQWNLDERRVDEWKMMFAGGATTQAEGVRPTPSGYSAVDSGASLAAVMGWRPLFKAWSTMAADRHSDTTSEKTHRRTPFVRQNTAPAKQPKNNELTNAIRFLLDLPE